MPINKSLHWSLCVVVHPGAIMNTYHKENYNTDDEYPCILFFDSLKAHRKNLVAKRVRKWLNAEWKRLKCNDAQEPFNEKTMNVIDPKSKCLLLSFGLKFDFKKRFITKYLLFVLSVPYQDNSCDCGVFVCRYAYALYSRINLGITFGDWGDKRHPFLKAITKYKQFEFDMRNIGEMRDDMSELISRLSAKFKLWKFEEDKKEKDAEEKTAKLVEAEQKAAAEKKEAGQNEMEREEAKQKVVIEKKEVEQKAAEMVEAEQNMDGKKDILL